MRRPRTGAVAVLLLLALLPACSGDPGSSAPTTAAADALRMASYDFAENQVLVEVYAEAARRAGVPVAVAHGIGTREIVWPAVEQGLADAVVDYTGTALSFARHDAAPEHLTPGQARAELERTLAARGLIVLGAARAEDQNGFAVTRAFADAHSVGSLSDLVPLAGELRFGGPSECPDRPFCLRGLEDVYGLHFGQVLSMPSRVATADALRADQIDVGMLETTDPRLTVSDLVLLTDDRELQPQENVVPLVRTDALERWGDRLRTAFDDVSARLTTRDLAKLNRAVEVGDLSPADAAAGWWAAT